MNVPDNFFDDIYTIWQPAWWQNPWLLMALSIAFVFLSVSIVVIYRKLKHKTQFTPAISPELALQHLVETPCDDNYFYSALLLIIHNHEYFKQSTRLTDYELLLYSKMHNMPAEALEHFSLLIHHAEKAKFAAEPTSQEERLADVQRAQELFKSMKSNV